MSEFFTWAQLATHGGALGAVLILTQLTKNLPGVVKIPTRAWSYVLALAVLYPALYFTGALDASAAVLTLFNAAIVSLAANGGYEAVARVIKSDK